MKLPAKIVIASLVSLAAIYGALVTFTPLRPLGLAAGLETRMVELGKRATGKLGISGLSQVSQLRTSLATISLTTQKLTPRMVGWGGALVEVEGQVILVDKTGRLLQWLGGSATRVAGPQVPMETEAFLASLQGKRWDRWESRTHFRVMDALARRTPRGHELLVTHNYWHQDRGAKSIRLSVLRFDDLEDLAGATWQTLLECQPLIEPAPLPSPFTSNEAGGRIASRDDSTVIVTFGNLLFGSVLWPDKPVEDSGYCYGRALLVHTTTGEASTFVKGLRNAQGLYVDSQGNVWETEHGPRGGDELNLLQSGSHYGWPHVSYGTAYESTEEFAPGARLGTHDGYRQPMLSWTPSIGVSNLVRIEKTPAVWKGDLLIGSLKSTSLYRIRMADGRVVLSERIPIGMRVRDLMQHSDGRILLWTDGGEIVELAMSANPMLANSPASGGSSTTPSALTSCTSCHSLQAGDDYRGPSLHGVLDRKMAATTFPAYSEALKARNGRWTENELESYLMNPARHVPGTTMPDLGLSPQTVDEIITHLREL
jgi:cytochrome c2